MKISHIIPLSIRLYINRCIRKYKTKNRIEYIRKERESTPIFYLLNIPSHGNMGDQLIAYAEENFFNDNFSENRVEYFSTGELECGVELLKPIIASEDIIFITGGGFLGDVYPEEERRFHDVMRLFPNNRIILLPQTFSYYKNSKSIKKAIALQMKCERLVITVRETSSYNCLQSHFNNAEIKLLPDMATYLNLSNLEYQRSGVIICSRNDKEKEKQSSFVFDSVSEWTKRNNIPIRFVDTQKPYSVRAESREDEIDKLVEEFASSRLVVTDRLHGMLYSIITGTPVLAIDNTTHKVSGAFYDWFKDFSYVRLYSEATSIYKELDTLFQMGGQKYDNQSFINNLKSIIDYAKS